MPENNWMAYKGLNQFVPEGITFKAILDQKFSKSDMAFLSKLYASTRWDEVLQAPWSDQQRIEFLQQQFEAQHSHYLSHYPNSDFLIILKDNCKIGRIYLDRDEVSICLIDIALLPECRKSGIGTELLKELLEEAQLTNKKIVIHVENFNPAYHWYLKLGFKQVEDKGVYQYMEWNPST
jgi:N-acetylglutamate synthase-like GNAT family acetyltransferase